MSQRDHFVAILNFVRLGLRQARQAFLNFKFKSMDDPRISSILEAINYIKEYGVKKGDLERLVDKDDLENFKNQIMAKLEGLHH